MIKQLDLYLEKFDTSSLFSELSAKIHGFILNNIDPSIATEIHNSQINPFSLFCLDVGDSFLVRVSSFNELGQYVINLLINCENITINSKKNIKIKVLERNIVLETDLYCIDNLECFQKYELHFVTPTAFKVNGKYLSDFNIKNYFEGIILKLNYLFGLNIDKQSVIDDLGNIIVENKQLQNSYFINDSHKISGYVGTVTLNLNNVKNIKLFNLLIRVGSIIGVGIKTAMGMGGNYIT